MKGVGGEQWAVEKSELGKSTVGGNRVENAADREITETLLHGNGRWIWWSVCTG